MRKTVSRLFAALILMLLFSIGRGQSSDTLIVGFNIAPPFATLEGGQPRGPSVWLWEMIAKERELPFKYRPLPLDSLLEGLANGKVDVGISPLTITSARASIIDFSSPYYIAHSSVLQKEKSAWSRAIDFIMSFFSINFFRALGALAFVILLFGLLVWLFERNHNQEEFGSGMKGLWNGFWWSAVTMTTVGYGDKSPRTTGGRMVALIWMFTAIMIISGFTASIASSLTMNQMDASAGEVLDFKSKRIGTIATSSTEEWLKQNFYTNTITSQKMQDLLDALQKNKIDAIAYDRPILREVTQKDSLNRYSLLDIKYNPQFYALGMSKSLPYKLKQEINITMLEISESLKWKVVLSEYDLD